MMTFSLTIAGFLLYFALSPSEGFLSQSGSNRIFSPLGDSIRENHDPYSQHYSHKTLQTRVFSKNRSKDSNKDFAEKPMCQRLESEIKDVPVGQLKPDVIKYFHPVMNSWAKRRSRKGAIMAERLMNRLSDEVEAGNTNAKLTTKICNTAIDAWAKSGEKGCAENATKILLWMNQMHKEKKYETRPDTISFSQIIDAHAKNNEERSGEKAESILSLMEKMNIAPNTITFNSVLNAWSRSNDMDKAVRVEELVRRMHLLHERGNTEVNPDVYSYQECIYAWSRSKVWGAPQRCEEILMMMDNEYKKGNKRMKANSFCFTAAINSWSKSRERRKARNAYKILQYMDKQYNEGNHDVRPNVVAYTSVLNACGFPPPNDDDEKKESFEIACLTFEELRLSDYDSPNHITYAAFLNVCARTLPVGTEKRDNMVRRTFQLCCEDGQVSSVVMDKLRLAASEDLYNELILTDSLPREWTCNVRGEKKIRNKRVNPSDKAVAGPSLAKLKSVKKARGKSGYYSRDKVKVNRQENSDSAKRKERSKEVELEWKQTDDVLEEISIPVEEEISPAEAVLENIKNGDISKAQEIIREYQLQTKEAMT